MELQLQILNQDGTQNELRNVDDTPANVLNKAQDESNAEGGRHAIVGLSLDGNNSNKEIFAACTHGLILAQNLVE